jgi:corrinoid protein of di/trimethylamine methyltransferase
VGVSVTVSEKAKDKRREGEPMSINLLEQIVEATVAGNADECAALAQQVLDQGMDPYQAIQEGYTKGMVIVGDKFARLEYFLPDLMLSASAVKAAMEVLQPSLMERPDRGSEGTVVLGTIQGDIHDLGKNIVKVMLQAAGFTVHDLGYDVTVRQFVDKAEEVGADIIAASAMLVTTALYMPDIASMLSELGLRDKYKIMLGGTPVTDEWAKEEAGADGYGEDAVEAVEVAERLMRDKKGRGGER